MLARPVNKSYCIFFSFISFFTPLVADCTLIVRVLAVYPPNLLPWTNCLGIYGPIVLFKFARLVNNLVFDVNVGRVLAKAVDPLAAAASAWITPEARIEWFLQMFDNTLSKSPYRIFRTPTPSICGRYTSGLFLIRIRQGEIDNKRIHCATIASKQSCMCLCNLYRTPATSEKIDAILQQLLALICRV